VACKASFVHGFEASGSLFTAAGTPVGAGCAFLFATATSFLSWGKHGCWAAGGGVVGGGQLFSFSLFEQVITSDSGASHGSHGLPPLRSDSFTLERVLVPFPHVTVQAPQSDQDIITQSNGHGSALQASLTVALPTQGSPPSSACTAIGRVFVL